jgi:hypothetical protein
MPDGRVLIAFDADAMDVSPTWTRIDDTDNLVAGIDIRRGRQTETDQTDTSTATVMLNDTDGTFDPDDPGSPYFGDIDGKQIMLQAWNPVAAEWVIQYRGFIDGYSYDFSGSVNADGEPLIATIALECVDAFDYLAGVEMIPGLFGEVPVPSSVSTGSVFYDDTDFQTRLIQLAADAQWPLARTQFFTGNVDVQEDVKDAGDSILASMRDVVDSEFPFLANLFTNKGGDVCAHGRKARFDPETVSSGTDWNFTRWKAGDGVAVAIDPTRAQIRTPLRWSRARSRIYNAALAYPKFPIAGTGGGSFGESDIPDQIRTDATSITTYGYRSWSAPKPSHPRRNNHRSRREGRVRPVRRLRDRELQGSAHPHRGDHVQEHEPRRRPGGSNLGTPRRRRHFRRRRRRPRIPRRRWPQRIVLHRRVVDEHPPAEPCLRHGRANPERVARVVLRYGSVRLMAPPSYHARTHVPGGSDPIEFPAFAPPSSIWADTIEAIASDIDLLGWWRLGDGASPFVDSSPLLVPTQTARNLSRHAAGTAMTQDFTPGALQASDDDGSVRFNAANNVSGDYLGAAGDTRFDLQGSPMTIACFVYPLASASTFLGHGLGIFGAFAPNSWPGGYGILVDWPTRELWFRRGAAGSSSTTWAALSGGVIPASEWSFVVGTFNGTSTHKLYLNGALVRTVTASVTVNSFGSSAAVTVGRTDVPSSTYAGTIKPGTFYGGVDEASLWRGEMTADQVYLLSRSAATLSVTPSLYMVPVADGMGGWAWDYASVEVQF